MIYGLGQASYNLARKINKRSVAAVTCLRLMPIWDEMCGECVCRWLAGLYACKSSRS